MRGEQNNILFPVRISWANHFPNLSPFVPPLCLEKILGRRPKPALLFLIAEKKGKKASTPGSHKIYFYTGILQLPTVGQVKCLYNSVKNKFYRRLQRGALNGNGKNKSGKITKIHTV